MDQFAFFRPVHLLTYSLVVTVISISMCKAEIFRSSCRNDALFKFTNKNKMLSGTASIVVSQLATRNLSFCGKHCIHNSQCLSFNYKKQEPSSGSTNCQLLNVVTTTSGTSLTSASGWTHYEPVTEVIFLHMTRNCCFFDEL